MDERLEESTTDITISGDTTKRSSPEIFNEDDESNTKKRKASGSNIIVRCHSFSRFALKRLLNCFQENRNGANDLNTTPAEVTAN